MKITGKPTIFIDGEVGTTGLQISDMLQRREDINLVQLPYDDRKKIKARKEAINDADVVILCLPDEAAREAVALLKNTNTAIIDASTAHRTAPGWTYGFTEYDKSQREKIKSSQRVSNPGCYAVGAISIIHPLIASGLIEKSEAFYIHGMSGYSGGGKKLISLFEKKPKGDSVTGSGYDYALGLQHKHVPEIKFWSKITNNPIFLPTVGPYKQGMLVHVPLSLWSLRKKIKSIDMLEIYSIHYAEETFIKIIDVSPERENDFINPQALNNTNQLHIHVLHNDAEGQAIVVAQLDNLGKGAAGQAVQTMNLLIGVEEEKSLI